MPENEPDQLDLPDAGALLREAEVTAGVRDLIAEILQREEGPDFTRGQIEKMLGDSNPYELAIGEVLDHSAFTEAKVQALVREIETGREPDFRSEHIEASLAQSNPYDLTIEQVLDHPAFAAARFRREAAVKTGVEDLIATLRERESASSYFSRGHIENTLAQSNSFKLAMADVREDPRISALHNEPPPPDQSRPRTSARRDAAKWAELYVPKFIRDQEEGAVRAVVGLAETTLYDEIPEKVMASVVRDLELNPEQENALRYCANGENYRMVSGRPGTGKSVLAVAIALTYKRFDPSIQVIGLGPMHKVAQNFGTVADDLADRIEKRNEGLGEDSNDLIEKNNKLALELRGLFKADHEKLTAQALSSPARLRSLPQKAVYLLDEGAMADTPTFGGAAKTVLNLKSKLITIGDERQLPAVNYSGLWAPLKNEYRPPELNAVKRQKTDWELKHIQEICTATNEKELKKAFTEALWERNEKGSIAWFKNVPGRVGRLEEGQEDPWRPVYQDIVEKWKTRREETGHQQDPETRQIVVTFRNAPVRALNEMLQAAYVEQAKAAGKELEEVPVETVHGTLRFAQGSRIQFEDSKPSVGIYKASVGTVHSFETVDKVKELLQEGKLIDVPVKATRITALMDDSKKLVSWDDDEFHAVQHGFALTTYASQGQTCMETHHLIDETYDKRAAALVAMSRARERTWQYSPGRQGMDRDIQALGASFAKPQEKAASIVYETEAQYRERIERDHRMEWEKDGAKPAPGHFLDYMKWQKEAPVREAEAPVKPGAEAAAKAAASAAELVEQQAGRMDLDVKFSFEAAANAPGMRETAPAPHDFSQTVPDAMNLDYLDNEPAAASPDSPALRPTALENQVVDDLAARFAGVSLNVQQRADSLTLLEGKLAQADSNHSAGAGKTADSDAAAKTPPVFTFGNWGDNFAAHIDTMFGGGLAQDRGTEEAAAVQQPAEARRALEKGPRDKVIAR